MAKGPVGRCWSAHESGGRERRRRRLMLTELCQARGGAVVSRWCRKRDAKSYWCDTGSSTSGRWSLVRLVARDRSEWLKFGQLSHFRNILRDGHDQCPQVVRGRLGMAGRLGLLFRLSTWAAGSLERLSAGRFKTSLLDRGGRLHGTAIRHNGNGSFGRLFIKGIA